VAGTKKIINLEKKLSVVENRLMLERNKVRFKETKLKRSYGKMFLIAGALDYYDEPILTDKETIELGALVITAKCDNHKLAVILGALNMIFKKCSDNEYLQKCIIIGDQYYETKKLDKPNNLFLGIAFKAHKFLSDSRNIQLCNKIGNQLFTENKKRKLELYKKYTAEKNGII
jgi:NAD(P)H-hydrate repair Nnr-like enzyme with NAD(P)H-hydrate dehydratase domain